MTGSPDFTLKQDDRLPAFVVVATDELGRVIDRCLGTDGRGLIHSIGRDYPMALNPWIRKRIFPGARPPSRRAPACASR